MEEVISNSHGTGLLIVNSDPIILNDAASINTLLNNNGSLLQGALNLLDPASKSVADSLKLNLVNNDAAKESDGGCIIVDGSVKLDGGNIFQLSLDDLNKLGLQLTFDNSEANCDLVKTNEDAVSGDIFLSSLTASKDKLFLTAPDTVSTSQLEPQLSLNVSQPINITNFGSVIDEHALKGLTFQQLDVVNPFDNDNMTYTLQLDNGSNGILSSRASGLAQAPSAVSASADTLIVSNITDHVSKKIGFTDQVNSDGKYSQVFRINTKPTNIELKPKTFIKANLNGIQNNVTNLNGIQNSILSKQAEDKTKVMKIQKGQPLIVKNRNNPTNLKLNQPNININALNNKTKRICILNKNVSGLQTIEKSDSSHKLIKVPLESAAVKTESKPIGVSGGVLNSNHARLANRTEPPTSAPSASQESNKSNKAKRLTQSQLQQIAAYLEKNRDDQGMITNPSTFYDTETNTKIICRVVYPEDFENGKNLKKAKTPTKAKPPLTSEKEVVKDTEVLTLLSFSRTRSGRLSRPPKHIAVGQSPSPTSSERPATTLTETADVFEPEFIGEVGVPKVNNQVNNKSKAPKEVGIPKKGVSWKKRMKVKNGAKPVPLAEILRKYSEVEICEAMKNKIAELPLWQCLLLKVSSSPEKDKVRLLCDELTSFAKSVSLAADQFLKPMTPETADSSIMLKSEVLSTLFKKSMGVYSSDSEALLKCCGDKRKREEDQECLINKKKKSDFDLKLESISPLHCDMKKEDSVNLDRLTPTSSSRDAKPSIDFDLGESVDELVNQRLASLQGDLVPTLSKSLSDDLLTNLLPRREEKKCENDLLGSNLNVAKSKVGICDDKKSGKSPVKFDTKSNLCEVKGSIDLDLGESVDELVNARLASLADEIVPSLPSRALGDDVLVGLLSDSSTSLFSQLEKTNTSSTSTNLLSGDAHSTSGIFSSLDKDISVSSSRSLLRETQTSSNNGLFSSIDKHVSPPPLSDTQSSSDIFTSLEKRISPSDSLLGDTQSSNSLFSLDKSYPSPVSNSLLMDPQTSTNLFSSLDKCVSTSSSSSLFPNLDKRVPSPSPSLLSSTNMFSSIETPSTTTSTSKRVTSTSSRSLLRSSQNSSATMLPPVSKSVPSRTLLSESNRTSSFSSLDNKRVSSTTSTRSLISNGQTVSSSSDLFSPLDKRVSASTEDLIKSLENLSAEIPTPSSAPLQDFSVFSQHFSRESKTAI